MSQVPIIQKKKSCNVVFESPHQGREVPDELRHHERLVQLAKQRMDTGINLVADYLLEHVGGTLISSPYSRLVVDLNRGQNRVDSRVCPSWPNASVHEDGGVIIPITKSQGRLERLYEGTLSEEEINVRLHKYWFPYHDQLQKTVSRNLNEYGQIILVSLHSAHPMPEHEEKGSVLYVGSQNGTTCDEAMLSIFCEHVSQQWNQVIAEHYYQGAFVTQAYGQEKDVHAIQLELDRRYLNMSSDQTQLAESTIPLIDNIASALNAIVSRRVSMPSSRRRVIGGKQTFIDPLTGEIQIS